MDKPLRFYDLQALNAIYCQAAAEHGASAPTLARVMVFVMPRNGASIKETGAVKRPFL